MRKMISGMMALVCALLICGALMAPSALASMAKVSVKSAGIYKTAQSKKPAAKLKKGTKVRVLAAGKKWMKVRYKSKIGYMKRSSLKKIPQKKKANNGKKQAKYRTLREGSSGAAVKRLQARLAAKGYLSKSAVTGRYGSGTRAAVRKFQIFNSLSISGNASASMQKRLYSSSARAEPKVSIEPWSSCDIDSRFPNGSTAVIIDIATGTRIYIRRLYGSNHCDVEPRSKADTARLRAIYGGDWSWDSRGVLLIAGGKCYAAAINSEPHGQEAIAGNNYPGQFCLHLRGSKTHKSNRVNASHQANIAKVYNYFK